MSIKDSVSAIMILSACLVVFIGTLSGDMNAIAVGLFLFLGVILSEVREVSEKIEEIQKAIEKIAKPN